VDAGQRRVSLGLHYLEQPIIDVESPEFALLAKSEAVAQGGEGLLIEELAHSEIAHLERDMVDHDGPD
jgi:hypothetical protein